MKIWFEVRGQLIWGAILIASAGIGLLTNQELAKASRFSDAVNTGMAFGAGVVAFFILTIIYAIVRAGSPDPQDQL